MKEQKEENKDMHVPDTAKPAIDELDAAGKSLSEALRMSFIILKVIMIVLVLAFLASGFKTVDSNEQALVLRFGKIHGLGEKRLLGPGLHWILPYPIDEIVKIPVETQVNLPIDSFWYYQMQSEILSGQMRPVRPDQPLKPLQDGYSITRGESQEESIGGFAGSDYNIVHSKWQLTYQIDDPERFFINTYIEDIKPGDVYFDVITESIKPLLKNVFEDAVVTALVSYTIDEAISTSQDRIRIDVKRLVQDKLDKIESGIKVVSVQLTASECPRQVKEAFESATRASQQSEKEITDARAFAANTLNEAAGPVAEQLFAALHDESVDEQTKELLWSQLAGTAREKIAEARTYRTKVVERARANADYFESILPEYRQRPKLVLQQIYLDAMENILKNADEKFVVQTTEGSKGTQMRVLLNRDPKLKKKQSTEQTEQGN
jgi:membrane protease subunit HflK